MIYISTIFLVNWNEHVHTVKRMLIRINPAVIHSGEMPANLLQSPTDGKSYSRLRQPVVGYGHLMG
jgi:hypothetical protein